MDFEWDRRKAGQNTQKHGIAFEIAITVFDDPFALIAPDPKHSQKENREWIIGKSDEGILVVVFTRRLAGNIFRIISARTANRKERRLYEEYKRIPVP